MVKLEGSSPPRLAELIVDGPCLVARNLLSVVGISTKTFSPGWNSRGWAPLVVGFGVPSSRISSRGRQRRLIYLPSITLPRVDLLGYHNVLQINEK